MALSLRFLCLSYLGARVDAERPHNGVFGKTVPVGGPRRFLILIQHFERPERYGKIAPHSHWLERRPKPDVDSKDPKPCAR
jgi:hypothetical protein